ncbi:MAG: hypothetical protein HRU19_02340 [Pseudobacteriovorax sp.]|nr:hypothetical protein [Pseudobacteriovorax sp.]
MTKKKAATRVLVSSCLALVVWGSWAYYVNQGSKTVWASAIGQGLFSFGITVFFTFVTEILHKKLPKHLRWMAPFLPYVVAIPSLIYMHWQIGTEHIVATITPSVSIGIIYMALYGRVLARSQDQT